MVAHWYSIAIAASCKNAQEPLIKNNKRKRVISYDTKPMLMQQHSKYCRMMRALYNGETA
tara:strand:+ start:34394 stop:34573 length:180 start_codon:yes stop_codon:yes gene_type:complete